MSRRMVIRRPPCPRAYCTFVSACGQLHGGCGGMVDDVATVRTAPDAHTTLAKGPRPLGLYLLIAYLHVYCAIGAPAVGGTPERSWK